MNTRFQYDRHRIEKITCQYPNNDEKRPNEVRVKNRQSVPSSSSKKNFDQGKEGSRSHGYVNVVSGIK